MSRKQRRSLPILRTVVSKVDAGIQNKIGESSNPRETISCSQFFYQQSELGKPLGFYLFLLFLGRNDDSSRKKQNLKLSRIKGSYPLALLSNPALAVAKHIRSEGRIERLLASVMLFKTVEQLVRNKAVERLKKVL